MEGSFIQTNALHKLHTEKRRQRGYQTVSNCENCNYLTHSSANLVNPDHLTLDAVVLSSCATGALVSWHVHTHHMLISGKKLGKKVALVLRQLRY